MSSAAALTAADVVRLCATHGLTAHPVPTYEHPEAIYGWLVALALSLMLIGYLVGRLLESACQPRPTVPQDAAVNRANPYPRPHPAHLHQH